MQTSPFFASQAPRTLFPVPSLVGGPSLAAAAQVFKVPKLNTALYHYTVFTMPLPGKLKHAKISIYFDKATLQTVYVSNVHALAVLCDEDSVTIQSALGTFIKNNLHFKEVFYLNNILNIILMFNFFSLRKCRQWVRHTYRLHQ